MSTHPPQLFEIVRLVRGYIQERTGKEPTTQDVAICLAGAAGTLAGTSTIHEGQTAQIYTEAKLRAQNWKQQQEE